MSTISRQFPGTFPTSIALAFIACLVCLSPQAAAPKAPPKIDPARAGFSAKRLQRIDERMREAVATGVMVGGHGLIARDGKIVYDQVWGDADREADLPVTHDTLYRIYSMSKPVTTVALLMLYEEGHFLLNDPIDRYLPEFGELQVLQSNSDGEETYAPARIPTIRDLMRHTAGFRYGLFGDTAVDQRYLQAELFLAPTLTDFSERLAQLPLSAQPGTRWQYSVSVDIQGRLIEAISGKSLGEFLQQRIFEPLGMNDTFFVVPPQKRARLAQLYAPVDNHASFTRQWRWTAEQTLEPAAPELTRGYVDGHLFESGGAGLVSTTDDYLRFALMLAGGGAWNGVRLLSPHTVNLMRSNHIQHQQSDDLYGVDAFGLGVGIVLDPATNKGELGGAGSYGWGGAAGTSFWIDPENDVVGIFMVQSIPHQTTLKNRFEVLTYQALLE